MSCDNMKPYACGGSMNPNTVQNPCDRSLHFEGADDVTINQGVGIDLTEGVHAYDAHGNEIEYTVEPEFIEGCEVGDHVITYTATGEGSRSNPTMCGETALYARACNIITEIKKRIITILQSANPIIRGLSDVLIQPDETFSPLSGVTAEDANGNELTVSYSGRYTNTADGDIATFDTPYTEPMVSLVADIDPIQDLHGYDSPWPAGGGKNKFNPQPYTGIGYNANTGATVTLTEASATFENNTISYTIEAWYNRVFRTPKLSQGNYKISMTNIAITSPRVSIYEVGGIDNTIVGKANYSELPTDWEPGFSITESGNYFVLVIGSNTAQTISFSYPQIELGSAKTAYEPYSNICPISGWDSVDVTRTGKNLLNMVDVLPDGSYNGNVFTCSILSNRPTVVLFDSPQTITFSYTKGEFTGSGARLEFLNGSSVLTSKGLASATPTSQTVQNVTSIRFNYGSGGTLKITEPQIELGSTVTDYEPFVSSDTITTTLPQTVYGGTLDVVSGVLTVTHGYLSLNTADMDNNEDYPGWRTSGISNLLGSGVNAPLNTIFTNISTLGAYSVGANTNGTMDTLILSKSYFNKTQSDWITLAMDIQFVVPLATTTTITLTPTQIDSLLGRNSVWADSGDVTVWYVDEIPQSAFSYPVRGKYIITYTAEDECGNRTEKERTIQVGEETFRTVIYEDKTLIINERSSDIEENERLHGRAEYVYDAMDNDNPYVFSSPEDVPWHYFAGYPERVEFGSEVHPTSTAYWFYYMNQVNTFDFTNLDTSNVTDMKYMFYDCQQIMNLDPELDTSNVTDMSHMFERCIATPEIDVSSFDTSNVTDMSSMFASCYNLRAIYAKPTFVTDNVTSSNLMFGYDAHLVGGMGTPYDSNYEDKTYARIDDLPQTKGYFTDKDHITEWFRTAIHYDGTLIINESSLDQATNRELHGDAVAVYPPLDADHDYVFYTTSGGGSPYDVYWYQNRNNIKSVKIGSPIKPTNTAFWFNACDKITEMDFTNMDTSDVTEMGWMFFGCSKLNEIEFGDSFDTGNVFNFVGMFQACSELESVDLSGFDTSSATLMGSMFNSDSSLKTIYASDAFVTDNVTSSSDMFSGCTSLVGGSGTVYNQNKTDAEYARIDNQPDEPGYFTSK